ncbi:formate C-acetyltransferase [Herbivorax sp. ANBcel31]|uniref:formate C-acetyltransferase n=1 Tax=Herbivorax sp. ANBcel31 TaxID=3069754 RepID=UPI0027B200FE|nr:formate C-acetyltransferase [Herbivorax sp. ANBcel31]MDQ2085861.1 formate C-acetyltransferase [Herbivorax sp. ANBcel31]
MDAWRGFKTGDWCDEIDVRNFINKNYTPYEGDESFLKGSSERTKQLWKKVSCLLEEERNRGGVFDVDTDTISTITSHGSGYIDRELEVIAGLQTDEPLKRALMPFGGLRMVLKGAQAYGKNVSPDVVEIFTEFRKTHNDGVYDVYTPEMRRAKKAGIITGLPDAYGRGRIIGDYRRVPLYGVDRLIAEKQYEMTNLELDYIDHETVKKREEIAEQIKSLKLLKEMAKSYGFDISTAAKDGREAVQWLYFAYLAAVKEQNGAAMSLGRVSTFLDVYFERDLNEGRAREEDIQELIDQLVIKLRMVRFLRTPDYEKLFSGDPTWVTESIGGMSLDGRTLVTKTSFRMLNTLFNLGPSPEPNLTVLWSVNLPDGFKKFTSKVSIHTSSIQYESDDIMRHYWGDDYGIACCVSAMRLGKQMQFFGARCNLAKALLYAINGGRDELTGNQIAPMFSAVEGEYLEYDDVMKRFDMVLDWVARLYMNTLNIIHYMHDKYSYERLQMALHDREVFRTMACGIAGLSVVADSLSAIKYAKVKPLRDKNNIVVNYEVEGDYPKYGNNDQRVDSIATHIIKIFMDKLRKQRTYRDSTPTLSILTITSNVVYGEKTGNTPDGRNEGEPLAPGANPMHGRDVQGALAVLSSISRLPYEYAQDGISYTFSVIPKALGRDKHSRINNLKALLDGYFKEGGHHININVFEKEILIDAMEHPEKYPQLTIRVSGYAVNFIKLTKKQQLDVINRTIHEKI